MKTPVGEVFHALRKIGLTDPEIDALIRRWRGANSRGLEVASFREWLAREIAALGGEPSNNDARVDARARAVHAEIAARAARAEHFTGLPDVDGDLKRELGDRWRARWSLREPGK